MHAGPGPRNLLSGNIRITEHSESIVYSAGEVFRRAGGYTHTTENMKSVVTEVIIVEKVSADGNIMKNGQNKLRVKQSSNIDSMDLKKEQIDFVID